ncbi:MAG: protein jag [Chloroflexi bacterium]|nr:protein jag [Chloroflexota bacterium]MBM3182691.1 protein jag [Chloroflexota bacterium]MBM4454202.1 protein jag [Chloroflexota bacterium]
MMEIEVSAKTVSEAIQAALRQLGADENEVEIKVLKKGRAGVLGMGSEEARVKVRLLDDGLEASDVARVAKEVLERLMEAMSIDGEVKVVQQSANGSPASLDVEGDDLGVLIGRRGQTLASLQYIVRLIVAEKMKKWVPLSIDVAGYKRRRYESLRSLALRLADQVRRSQRLITLEPMPSDERRIIHLALANHQDIVTQSMGDGATRKVAILLKKR